MRNKMRGEYMPRYLIEKTTYSPSTFAEMVQTLAGAVKQGSQVRVHSGKLLGVSFMEAQYQKMKANNQEIRLYSSVSINDRCSFYLRDITEIEVGEDPDIDYITFKLLMKDKTFVSLTPLK